MTTARTALIGVIGIGSTAVTISADTSVSRLTRPSATTFPTATRRHEDDPRRRAAPSTSPRYTGRLPARQLRARLSKKVQVGVDFTPSSWLVSSTL